VLEPTESSDENGKAVVSVIAAYGDTLHAFVERKDYSGPFLPGYRTVKEDLVARPVGLLHIDHCVGNVGWNAMNEWVKFYEDVMGFGLYQHFDDNDISTEYSALMSKVMANGNGYVKFPINEPAEGKRKSQIEEYLDFYGGPGVQHIALATNDILETVSRMQKQGVEVLTVPIATTRSCRGGSGRSMSRLRSWSGWGFWWIGMTRAICCRFLRGPWRTGLRCFTRLFSGKVAGALVRGTSRRCLRR